MKITGVLGGSFNPIHNAHLAMAECAHRQFDIPEILIMPTAATYYKDGSVLIDPELRMDMIRIAISENGAQDYMKPSYLDLERGGTTYTYDTIKDLKKIYDKIYFILGADSIMYIDKWINAKGFLPDCTLLAALRNGVDEAALRAQTEMLIKDYGADIHFLDTRIMPYSSSDIRSRIKAGKDVTGMMPDGVIRYIRENGLYL